MKRLFLLLFLFSSFVTYGDTLYAYRIIFKDKALSPSLSDSLTFVGPRSVARRVKQNIRFNESDRPVSKAYIDSVLALPKVTRLLGRSKWTNSIVVLSTDSMKSQFSGVAAIESTKIVGFYPNGWTKMMREEQQHNPKLNTEYITYNQDPTPPALKTRSGYATYGASYMQIHLTNTDYLHDLGFRGEGKLIAVCDMGFRNIKYLPAFDSMNLRKQVIDTYNFVKDTTNVDSFNVTLYHGTDCLGCIAGNKKGVYVGSAPYSDYCLYMSEDYAHECPYEEDAWVFAAERADSIGCDVMTTSLGYFIFDPYFQKDDYTYQKDFDGKTTWIARGHNIAFSKGMFMVCANGNFGILPWKYLITPADADSVYSVGIVDSFGKYDFNYSSSFGPSNDGQVKPDGCGVGHLCALLGNTGGINYANGSSFSAPTIAGGITCLMQALPNLPVWEIKKLVHQSSSHYLSPTDSFGYGIPNFKIAFLTGKLLEQEDLTLHNENSIIIYPNPCNENIQINNLTDTAIQQVEILDQNGNIILNAQPLNAFHPKISLNDIPNGNYYLRIYLANKKIVVKNFSKI